MTNMNNVLNTDLSGKVAVITGAGGVLCSRMAMVLARAGAKTALISRSMGPIARLADEINQDGGISRAYQSNVLDKLGMEAVAARIQADLGPCDILINGAGGNDVRATTDHEYYLPDDLHGDTKSFFDLDGDSIDAVFSLNFKGALISTQVFAKQMLGRGGNIINISSMNAYRPLTKIPAYSGAKAAVSNFTQWLAVYFSRAGIRVNAIAPGFFSGKQNARLLWNEDGSPTERTKKILTATPLGRFGTSEELDGSLLFLVNDEAAGFITGVVLPVDGGFSAYSGV